MLSVSSRTSFGGQLVVLGGGGQYRADDRPPRRGAGDAVCPIAGLHELDDGTGQADALHATAGQNQVDGLRGCGHRPHARSRRSPGVVPLVVMVLGGEPGAAGGCWPGGKVWWRPGWLMLGPAVERAAVGDGVGSRTEGEQCRARGQGATGGESLHPGHGGHGGSSGSSLTMSWPLRFASASTVSHPRGGVCRAAGGSRGGGERPPDRWTPLNSCQPPIMCCQWNYRAPPTRC